MTHFDDARQAILELGSEDYYVLADAAVYLPTVPPEQRLDVAIQAMLSLLREGSVQIFFGRLATNDVAALPLEAAEVAIRDPRSWELAGNPQEVFCFANTPKGDELYFGDGAA